MIEDIKTAQDFLAGKSRVPPKIGMITGTGLGGLTQGITAQSRIPFAEIPHFPRSTVEGHGGTLVMGQLAGHSIMALEGRFHIYEGYTPNQVVFPVRVMAMLGVEYLLISSAAGGLNPDFRAGDLMVVTGHINLTGTNPLIGPNLGTLGPRFPDMSRAYGADLISVARQRAADLRIPLRQGVYAGIMGPSLETPAETRFLRLIGADAVGMSTVLESIAGVHCGLKILAIMVITNLNLPDHMKQISVEEVIATAQRSSHSLSTLWERIIGGLSV